MKNSSKMIAHDHLSEASVKFKTAVERQVQLMVMHNDSHEMLKEEVQKLATQARKEFRGISYDIIVPWKTQTRSRPSSPTRLIKLQTHFS
jgi:hypothetical protein